MTKQIIENDIKIYSERLALLQKDMLRIEGIIIYLQDKIKNLQNSDLTNS
jgi:hypothetical protein